MRIIAIEGHNARCDAGGVERDVSLFMLQEEGVKVDDFVIVHVGYAIQKVTPEEAQTTWELFDELLRAEPDNETEPRDA
jgi:hydrogenase expression/formation protein HypC